MSNDTPPRACLADFDFITTVPDPVQKLSTSAQTDGGTPLFKSPERLVPEEFGKKDALPTQQADIYAFGLVIFQVRERDHRYWLSSCIVLQVLTGETPFRGVQIPALGYFVLRGKRPTKPENSSAIGFSDSLWAFTQQCWDGKMELRPKAGEIVARLGEAAAGWDGLMPPSSQVSGVTSNCEETSDSKKHGQFDFFFPSPNVDHQTTVFQPSLGVTKSQATSGPVASLSQPLWRGLGHYTWKVLGLFGCWR